MIGLLLGTHDRLVAFLAAADDLVGDIEHLELDTLDARRIDPMLLAKLDRGLQRRLGMDLSVEPLQDRATHGLEVLGSPVDREGAGDGLHEALGSLEDLLWAR